MRTFLFSLFSIQLTLFCGCVTLEQAENDNSASAFLEWELLEDTWLDLGLPIHDGNKESYRDKWIQWIAKKNNQKRLIHKVKSQFEGVRFDSTEELKAMLSKFQDAMTIWSESSESSTLVKLGKTIRHRIDLCSYSIKNSKNIEYGKTYKEEKECIEALRDSSEKHKLASKDSIISASKQMLIAGENAVKDRQHVAFSSMVAARNYSIQCSNKSTQSIRELVEAEQRKKQLKEWQIEFDRDLAIELERQRVVELRKEKARLEKVLQRQKELVKERARLEREREYEIKRHEDEIKRHKDEIRWHDEYKKDIEQFMKRQIEEEERVDRDLEVR